MTPAGFIANFVVSAIAKNLENRSKLAEDTMAQLACVLRFA